MTEELVEQAPASVPRFTMVGEADAAACVGDVCELPAHRDHAIMNRRLDDDAV